MWDGGRQESTRDAALSAGSAAITAGAANTKGAWVQLIAATTFETSWVTVQAVGNSASARYLVDIGIGAAGAEWVLFANVPLAGVSASTAGTMLQVPFAIPAGVRIAARVQSSTASVTIRAQVVLCQGGVGQAPPLGRATTWGADTVDSGGALVDAGATVNTKGAWGQIIASTDQTVRWLCIHVTHGAIVTVSGIHFLVDIGVGAAGSEGAILSNLYFYYSTSNDAFMTPTICLPVNIPAGVRVAARAQASIANTTATDTQVDVVLVGVG